MYFIGLFAYLLTIVLATAVSTYLRALYNFQSIIVVIGAILSTLIATRSFRDFIIGLKVLINDNTEININQLESCINLYKLLFKVTLASGGIGWLLANISMIDAIQDPSIIIIVMTRSLLPILYSLIISFIIILPAQYILLKKRQNILAKNKE